MPRAEEELWRRSSSPEESWSDADGADEDGEWPVYGIVGEEVNYYNELQYEVKWLNWSRPDGSDTTWTDNLPDRQDIVYRWEKEQTKRRNRLAEESFAINITQADPDFHNCNTELRAQAYEEKKKKYDDKLSKLLVSPYALWDSQIEAVQQKAESNTNSGSHALRASTIRKGKTLEETLSYRGSPAASSSSRNKPISSASSYSKKNVTPIARTSSRAAHKLSTPSPAASLEDSPLPTISRRVKEERHVAPVSSTKKPPTREALQRAWDKVTRKAYAASVEIINNVDNEELPVSGDFRYIENKYSFDDDDVKAIANVESGHFVTCECDECIDASDCHCQVASDLVDADSGKKVFAYNPTGIFTFSIPPGMEVVECNKRCNCDVFTCKNRVAQKPRDIPIIIFKTRTRGWGARAAVDVERGKVLGIYTGNVIRREHIEYLPESHMGYLFDLDCTERGDGNDEGSKFSVDSYKCGNWTRFINHSCTPNLIVYSVVYDTVCGTNIPYLAFVADKNIPAKTELTINYHPSQSNNDPVKRSGVKCMCGSKGCRGWVH